MPNEKRVDDWGEEVTDKPAKQVSSWDEEVVDTPQKKNFSTTSTVSTTPASQPTTPSSTSGTEIPTTYQWSSQKQPQTELAGRAETGAEFQQNINKQEVKRTTDVAAIEKKISEELKAKTEKEKRLIVKEKIYNYLKSFMGQQPQGEGEPTITEEPYDPTPIDVFKPIDLEIEQLNPQYVREEGVDEGLRKNVVMKNLQLQSAIKKDKEQMLPELQKIKTVGDLKKMYGQTANEVVALSDELTKSNEQLKSDYNEARKLNEPRLQEMGFTESFGEGIKQTQEANSVANALYSDDMDRFGELLEKNYTQNYIYGDRKVNSLGQLLGGQALPIGATFTAAVLSGGNPAVAGMAGTVYYARLDAGSEAIQVYNEARSQGRTHAQAVSLAAQASKAGFVAGGVEGALGSTFGVGELAKGAMKLSKPAVKAIFSAAADAGVDAGAAMGAQYYKTAEAIKQGIKRDEFEGVAQEGAAEAVFGLGSQAGIAIAGFGFQLLAKGARKLKANTPKVYNQLVTQYGKVRPDITNGTIDQAIQSGEISPDAGQQLKTDLAKSYTAQQKLEGVEIPEEKQAEVVQLQTRIDDLEAQKENASPAVLPAIEKQIEDTSAELQIAAGIGLNAQEKAELNKLQTARDENKAYDKDRLKVLEKRQEAAKRVADEKREAAKKAKEEETIKRQQEEEAAKLQEQKTSENEKAKKADIERRRQEELNQPHTAGYSTIALDYLFTGGKDVIQSTDYLLQALVGGFSYAAKEIDAIRNKYANKIGNLKDDINSEVYNSMMNEIRDVINKNYSSTEAIQIFDKILNNATGFFNREGNQVSIELDKVNESVESKINAKYDAELEQLKTEQDATKTIEQQESVSTERESGGEVGEADQASSSNSLQRETGSAEEGQVETQPTEQVVEDVTTEQAPTGAEVTSETQVIEPTADEQAFSRAADKKIRMAERDAIFDEAFGERSEKAKFVFKNFKNIVRDLESKGKVILEGDCF